MKRIIFIFVFVFPDLILSSVTGCREQQTVKDFEKTDKQTTKLVQPTVQEEISSTSTLVAEKPLPKISFEKAVCDLGEVGQGTKNTCEFKFANTGQGLLKIENIKRTCGCTVFTLDKTAKGRVRTCDLCIMREIIPSVL